MTYQNQAPARRPGGITVLAVLIVISGLLGLIGSIAVIIGRGNDDFVRDTGVGSSTLLWVGIVGVIIAVVYLLVARGLTRGSGLARDWRRSWPFCRLPPGSTRRSSRAAVCGGAG